MRFSVGEVLCVFVDRWKGSTIRRGSKFHGPKKVIMSLGDALALLPYSQQGCICASFTCTIRSPGEFLISNFGRGEGAVDGLPVESVLRSYRLNSYSLNWGDLHNIWLCMIVPSHLFRSEAEPNCCRLIKVLMSK